MAAGVYTAPPKTPSPPAFVTAAASFGDETENIPASRTGCLIPNSSVAAVLSVASFG